MKRGRMRRGVGGAPRCESASIVVLTRALPSIRCDRQRDRRRRDIITSAGDQPLGHPHECCFLFQRTGHEANIYHSTTMGPIKGVGDFAQDISLDISQHPLNPEPKAKPRNARRNHTHHYCWGYQHRSHCETEEKPYRNVQRAGSSNEGDEAVAKYAAMCMFVLSQAAEERTCLRQGMHSRSASPYLIRIHDSVRSLHIALKRYA